MRYRPLGRTGLRVSELGFGTITFGRSRNGVAKVDQAAADRMVGRALDAGVNLFDTAAAYSGGQAEEILGRALGARRDEVLLATKVDGRQAARVNVGGLSAANVIGSCEASLRRLGTDRIDILQVDHPDPDTPFEQTALALDDLVRRGLVRYVGLSDFAAWEAALAIGLQQAHHLRSFMTVQSYYSIVGRECERDLLPLADRTGLAVIVSSPLAGGFLTGKYGHSGGGTIDDRRTVAPFPHVDPTLGAGAVDALGRIAGEIVATPAQVALAWLLGRQHVTSVLLGASSIRQLYENLRGAEIGLSPEQRHCLDEIATAPAEALTWRSVFVDDDRIDEITLP